jgi:hypothetical protein
MKELYTETSQYRHWYYSKEKLQEIREKNHASAVERVKQKVFEEAVSERYMMKSLLKTNNHFCSILGIAKANFSKINAYAR